MQNGRSRYPPALITGTLLGLLVCLLFVVGAAAQDTGSGAPPASPAIDHQKPVVVPTVPPAIIIAPTTLTVTEPSGWATFTASLTSQPTSFVVLPFSTSNLECTIDTSQVTWLKSDWQHVFVITVTAKDDEIFDGDRVCTINTGPATSIDLNYHQLDPEDVKVVVQDNEYRGWVYLPAILRSWLTAPTETEPNDTPLQANGPVGSDVTWHGVFPDTSDIKDYYYIELTAAHTLEGWLTNIPAGENYDLVLRYSYEPYDVVPDGYSGNLENADEHILTGVLAPGRYYIQIFNRAVGPGSTQPYHLRVVYK